MGEIVSRILKRISTILSIIIGTVLLFSIYAWAQVNVLHEPYAKIFGYTVFDVVTGSMSGTIEIEDYVLVKDTDNYKVNDIITFKYDNALITHRIIEIAGDEITTKGDVNNSVDYAIKKDQVIGKVVYVIPRAGIWKNVLTKPAVLSCIFISLISFAFFFSFEEKRYIEVRIRGNMDILRQKPKQKKAIKVIGNFKELFTRKEKKVQANFGALKSTATAKKSEVKKTVEPKKTVTKTVTKKPKVAKANLENLKKLKK